MARRLVERGVRFVQIFSGGVGNQNTDTWDAHGERHGRITRSTRAEVDLPIAGLLTDLKARGLLDTTLVIWQASSAACRFRSAASAATTIRARMTV